MIVVEREDAKCDVSREPRAKGPASRVTTCSRVTFHNSEFASQHDYALRRIRRFLKMYAMKTS